MYYSFWLVPDYTLIDLITSTMILTLYVKKLLILSITYDRILDIRFTQITETHRKIIMFVLYMVMVILLD